MRVQYQASELAVLNAERAVTAGRRPIVGVRAQSALLTFFTVSFGDTL
jgi:hypothetical protein